MRQDSALTEYITGSYPNVPRATVTLRYLPEPDQLEDTTQPTGITLITNDGTGLTVALTQELLQRGHQVVVLSFGEDLVRKSTQALPVGAAEIVLPDTQDETLGQTIRQLPGTVARFIYLHPHLRFPLGQLGMHFIREKSLLKAVFLLAKHEAGDAVAIVRRQLADPSVDEIRKEVCADFRHRKLVGGRIIERPAGDAFASCAAAAVRVGENGIVEAGDWPERIRPRSSAIHNCRRPPVHRSPPGRPVPRR